MDPVADLAALAAEHGIGCHVDACIGGFVLPFLERTRPRRAAVGLPGRRRHRDLAPTCTSTATAPKGASVILHRDADWFGHQVFLFDDWGSGLYGSPGVAGAKPAGADRDRVGGAHVPRARRATSRSCATCWRPSTEVRGAIEAIDGVELVGDPIGPVLAMRSDTDRPLRGRRRDGRPGWNLNRNTEPHGLHLMLSPAHGERRRRARSRSHRRGRAPRRVARQGGPVLVNGARRMTPDDLVEIELIKLVKYRYFRFLDLKQWDDDRRAVRPRGHAARTAPARTRTRAATRSSSSSARRWDARRSSRAHKAHHPEIDAHRARTPRPASGRSRTWSSTLQWELDIRGAAFYEDDYVKRRRRVEDPAHRVQARDRGAVAARRVGPGSS